MIMMMIMMMDAMGYDYDDDSQKSQKLPFKDDQEDRPLMLVFKVCTRDDM